MFAWGFGRIAGRVAGTNPPNLFMTLGRHPRLFRGWLRFAGRLMPGGTLPRRETELAIIRVAQLRACAYELSHHERLGRRAGLTAAEIARVKEGPAAEGWSPRERALLDAVDELHARGDLGDETWGRLAGHLDERGLIELVLLVGHYEMLATALLTLRVEPDGPDDDAVRAGARRPPGSALEQDGVLVRVRGRAAAQQDQVLALGGPQLVLDARRDDHAVAGPDRALLAAEAHAPLTGGEEVDLLGAAVQVGDGRPAGRHDGLGQALVRGVSRRDAGQLADRGAVRGDERLALLAADDLHAAHTRGGSRRRAGRSIHEALGVTRRIR